MPVWAEVTEELNKMNRYNVSPADKKPFAWLPEAEREDNYWRRSDALKGWSKRDPRIRESWASLTSFGKCANLYAFSRETVERIQTHLPIRPNDDDIIPWPGCDIPSYECVSPAAALTLKRIKEVCYDHALWLRELDTEVIFDEDLDISDRFAIFFRIAQLNTAMQDLRRETGPYWYRESGSANSDVVIKEARGTSLQKAINRFYCCYDNRQHRWSGDRWGTDDHLSSLAQKRAASDRLCDILGEDMCERIEVLGEAREELEYILDELYEELMGMRQ